ncbi:MAG TPA: universal stress protein [Solirubrobacteraceae bacterium]
MTSQAVVGVDGSEGGLDAIALARRLVSDANLTLVNAYGILAIPPGYVTYSDAAAQLERAAVEMLQHTAAERARGAQTLAMPFSAAGFALHVAAEQQHADLIVIGSAHRGPVGRVLVGDDCRATIHGAPCPVAVAPHDYAEDIAPIERVLVGFNGRPESRAAVEQAAAIAHRLSARLRVITVVEPPGRVLANYAYALDWPELVSKIRDSAQHALDELLRELENAEGEVVVGIAADEIERATDHADVVVLGSRGWGPVRRVLLGSTSDRLVHRSPCPVIVVPRPVDAPVAPPALTDAERAVH